MNNNNELIQVFFNLGQENSDWIKREPRKIIDSIHLLELSHKTIKQQIKVPSVKQKQQIDKEEELKIFRNIDNILKYLTNREKESFGHFSSKEEYAFIGRLDALLNIMDENKAYYSQYKLQECINRIIKIKQRVWKKEPLVSVTKERIIPSIGKSNTSKKGQVHSKRGLEIQNRLQEIKVEIKRKDLLENEKQQLVKELSKLKQELSINETSFTKFDNIPIKISQIENYLEKLNYTEPTQIVTRVTKNITSVQSPEQNNSEGKTTRGIEIQEILSKLQEETKRKELNPIEKENLRNTLLNLKKEMILQESKFSKFDSIPVRLNQVENYLERLKEKLPEKPKVEISTKTEETIPNSTNNKTKKEKPKVIWKFGL